MSGPAVLTAPELTQRSSQPVCLIQSEEILRVRTPAYSRTKSDLSFMVRQPSASAICTNDVELLLEVSFVMNNGETITVKDLVLPGGATTGNKYKARDADNSDYGFMPQMLPIQNKCIRNAVITINGSSQSHRVNEYGTAYCLLHSNREYMNKIGGGINDFNRPITFARGASAFGAKTRVVQNTTECKQYKRWVMQHMQDHTDTDAAFAGNVTPTFQFQEKLFIGPFGAFQQCESYPAWSCESQKSPGLLHVHNLQLQLAMEDNWWRNLYLAVYNFTKNASGNASVVNINVLKAELLTRWVLPPPRMISAALTQQVSYATYDVLRFVADAEQGATLIDDGSTTKFTLNAVSYPYMPSIFIFEVGPHYAHQTPFCGRRTSESNCLYNMKKDKRMAITHMDLSINTSSAAVPFVGGSGQVQVARINARDLYRMTLENCASFEKFPFDFIEWYENCGIVAITPSQLSGVLNSPNIRGSVVLQGDIFCRNLMGFPVNVSRSGGVFMADGDALDGVVYPNGEDVPRFQCLISGIYTNRSLVLDAKSGILNEDTFSAAFQSSLRLGSGGGFSG